MNGGNCFSHYILVVPLDCPPCNDVPADCETPPATSDDSCVCPTCQTTKAVEVKLTSTALVVWQTQLTLTITFGKLEHRESVSSYSIPTSNVLLCMQGSVYYDANSFIIVCSAVDTVCEIEGQEFTECGSACPSTCASPDSADFCTDVCVKGCQCPSGTVLDEVTYQCVETKQCSELIKICTLTMNIYLTGSLHVLLYAYSGVISEIRL